MKIEIEFTESTKAKLVIDGRELQVLVTPGCTKLTGVKLPETEQTLGGIVAGELYGLVADIMQAWATAESETWDTLSEDIAEEIEDIF